MELGRWGGGGFVGSGGVTLGMGVGVWGLNEEEVDGRDGLGPGV